MARPVKYETPEQMQEIIDRYFDDCKRNRVALTLEQEPPQGTITDDLYPAVSGLALCLDMSRQGLIEYSEKDAFSDTVKRAKNRIQAYLEQRLFMPQPTGVIFNLKNNYGWKDSQDFNHRSPDGSMSPPSRIELVPASDDSTTSDT